MTLATVGEFNLIDQLAEVVQKNHQPSAISWRNLILGIGDDAAVWQSENGPTMATTDCLIEGIHFTLDTTSWYDLGWKALAVNLSDIAAMGGRPRYALVTLGLPGKIATSDIIQLYNGMTELAGRSKTAIVGGNVSAAPVVFISITVIGQADNHILTRRAAHPGEVVAVTGSLGRSAGGLRLLQTHCDELNEGGKALREAHLKPFPRLEMGTILVAEGVHCATDISDGLVLDLEHICQQSGVGAEIEVSQVPQPPELSTLFGAEALPLALGGGEDYELLFTAPVTTIAMIAARAPCPVTIIGRITAENPGNVILIGPGGKNITLNDKGWQHFARA